MLPSARSCPDFCTPLVQTPPTGKSDAASEMLKLGGAEVLSAAHAASTSHLRSSHRREAPLFEICAAEIFSPASGVLTSSLGVRVRRFFGAVGQGVRCRLMFSWWCVWLNVRRLFGIVLGGNRFLQCNDAKVEISILLLLCFMKWTL